MKKTALAIAPYNEAWIWIKATQELGYNIIVVSPDLKQESRIYQQLNGFTGH